MLLKKLSIKDNLIKIIKLSFPLILTNASLELMIVFDSIMLGKFNTEHLAYYSLSNSTFSLILEICFGLLIGTLVLSSEAFGRKDLSKCVNILKRSIPYALLVSLFAMAFCGLGEVIFKISGQDIKTSMETGRILMIMGLTMPAILVYTTHVYFLESIEQVKIPMIIAFISNVINIFFNWVFIYGHFGFKGYGAIGCAISTVITIYISLLLIILYIKHSEKIKKYFSKNHDDKSTIKKQKEIGYAVGFSMGLEEISITLLFLIIGRIGTNELSIFGIYYTIICILFMASRGIGQASAILIAASQGKKDYKKTLLSSFNTLNLAICINLLCILAINLSSNHIYKFYTNDNIILEQLIKFTPLFTVGLLFDSLQTTLATVLRGRGETWFLSYLQFGISNFIMLPLAYILAINFGMKIEGILISYLVTTFILFTTQLARFLYLYKKDIENKLVYRLLSKFNIKPNIFKF